MRRGVSAIEVIIAAAVLVVIAVVAVPNLMAGRRAANETHAATALKKYADAQAIWKRNNYSEQGNRTPLPDAYCDHFVLLHAYRPDDGPVGLIPEPMSEAVSPATAWTGYWFADRSDNPDWRHEFGLTAMPAVYGRSGTRSFFILTEGLVWSKDLGEQQPLPGPSDFRSPGSRGWVTE